MRSILIICFLAFSMHKCSEKKIEKVKVIYPKDILKKYEK